MAKVNESGFKDWQDGQKIPAADYKAERSTITAAINATDTDLQNLKVDFPGTWQGFSPSQVDQTLMGRMDAAENEIGSLSDKTPNLAVSGLKKITVDSTFDNAPLIQAIINNNNRGKIILPEGTYKVSNIILKSGISLVGQGINKTILQGMDNSKNIIEAIGTAVSPISACTVEDLTLSGASTNSSLNGFYGKYFTNNSALRNIACNYNGNDGVKLELSWVCEIYRVEATYNVGKGFNITEDTNAVTLIGCTARNNGSQGFDIYRCYNTGLFNCDSEGNGAEGVRILSGFSISVSKSYIENNTIDNILIDWINSSVGVSRGIKIEDNYLNGLDNTANGLTARNVQYLSTKNNYFRNHTSKTRVIESTVAHSILEQDYDYNNLGDSLLSTSTTNITSVGGFYSIDKELKMNGKAVGDVSVLRGRSVANLDVNALSTYLLRMNYGSGGSAIFYGGGTTSLIGLLNSGDIENYSAGKGIILKSPDGLTRKRISIDNTGAIIATTV